MTEKKTFGLSSSTLHILAMLLMLCDHLCMTLLGNVHVLHYIGRIAFPIFAFMLVEGFRHTSNVKKYLLRLLIFALISEIPFDFMCGGTWFYFAQQNVLFTFILAILAMLLCELPKKLKKPVARYLVFGVTGIFTLILFFILGSITMVDYFGGGIIMVLIFYFFREDEILSFKVNYSKKWMSTVVRIINMFFQAYFVWTICCELIGGLCVNINVFGKTVEVVVESFGILALLPIWLYNGKKGINSKPFKYLCYAFYPAHIAILVIIKAIWIAIAY